MDPLGAGLEGEPRVHRPVLVITPLAGPQVPQDLAVAKPNRHGRPSLPESPACASPLAPRHASSFGIRDSTPGSRPAAWLLSSVLIAFLFLSPEMCSPGAPRVL